ncbi:MAG: zinc-binding dehydrogenase [Crocinitomix sp.]|nr:zinc-binding dehydrogenase [Crocinitomix sp.]
MKAVICTKYGSPEVLQLQDVEKPIPKHNEVLIKIIASNVTASDCIVRSGKVSLLYWIPMRLALGFTRPRQPILGQILSGIVEGLGKDVKDFEIGDKVFAHTFMKFGTYAEYICLPESSALTNMPENSTFEEAASIPFGGTLALFFLKKAQIKKGQNVLIYGASGAVGTAAVQIAKNYGAIVDGVCSSTNLKLVKALGADIVFDYTSKDFRLDDGKYDLIFDAVGKKKSKGFNYKNALMANGKFLSVDNGNPGKKAVCKENLNILKDLVESKRIKPVIDRKYSIEQIVEAHRYVDKGHKKGNVIISFSDDSADVSH